MLLLPLLVLTQHAIHNRYVLHHTQILPQIALLLLLTQKEELLAILVAKYQLLRTLLRREDVDRRRHSHDIHLHTVSETPLPTHPYLARGFNDIHVRVEVLVQRQNQRPRLKLIVDRLQVNRITTPNDHVRRIHLVRTTDALQYFADLVRLFQHTTLSLVQDLRVLDDLPHHPHNSSLRAS